MSSAAVIIVCRSCRRKLHVHGLFWADDSGQIYCSAAIGQHVPARAEPDTP